MTGLEELSANITGGQRVVVIAERDIDLRQAAGMNRLVLLKMALGSLAAGGRGGGFGERRVTGVAIFSGENGRWTKNFENSDESVVSGFEVPYYVTRIPITLPDGSETMGYGVVDADLVGQMLLRAGISSSS